jgi:hypothetical protein
LIEPPPQDAMNKEQVQMAANDINLCRRLAEVLLPAPVRLPAHLFL